jgi:pimeloyl-ACP methyl ester carboxylesterase
VLAAVTFDVSGNHPGVLEGLEQLRPEDLHPTPYFEEYLRIAPRPQDFPILVEKVKDLNVRHQINYPPSAIRAMRAPTLIVIGDSDVVRPEHAVEMFRLLGGGVLGAQPNSELAILPGTNHVTLVDRADLLLPIIPAFLDRPMLS